MTAAFLPWVKFAACAVLIGMAGPVLTHYGDVIARLTGLRNCRLDQPVVADCLSAERICHIFVRALMGVKLLAPPALAGETHRFFRRAEQGTSFCLTFAQLVLRDRIRDDPRSCLHIHGAVLDQ